ncbi:MAG: type transport system ATP-binding protein [Acidimicrobiaceae bacterium]|nr:type transport system ATP-binding protein [Acidimicrobiaceae bacterium]MDQ1377445.1 type transport system ATP-binding protein [Acidimicrobiaceae bacterium]
MPGPAIEVRDLVVRYGKTIAVNRISFEARAGQVTALLGPNGAGKTSTLETLEGYRRPTVGTVRVLGLDPVKDHRALTRRIGVMLQRGGVYPGMSPREAVRLFASYYDESEEPEGVLYRVGLTSVATTPWRRLSGGEQQRLSLALALVGRPWVAFLDEPTAGVDPQGRLAIREVINDLRSAGSCVLLTTHEMTEAERLADRIIILDHGEIVADGTTSELTTKEGGKGIRFGAPAGLDTIALGAALMATVDEEQPGEYLVHADPKPATIAAITAWLAEKDLALSDLRAGRERLEDVFLRLTGRPESTNGTVARDPAPPEDEIRVEPAAGRRRRRVADGGRGPGATEPQE